MSQLLEAEVTKREWYHASDIPKIEAEAQHERNEKILDQIPAADRIRKLEMKLEKEREKIEEAKRDELAKAEKWNTLTRERELHLKDIQSAENYVQAAQQTLADIDATIIAWYFCGGHPRVGRDAPARLAFDSAAWVSGCKRIIEVHATWLPTVQEKIAKVEEELIEMARSLQILDKLPPELQERAKAK